MGERKTVFVTKFALTNGIVEATVNDKWTSHCDDSGKSIYADWPGACNNVIFLWKKDWCPTLEEAQARVSEMVNAKLKSLDKQRAKLEKLAKDGAKVVRK